MKRLIVLFIVCASFLGCEIYMDKLGIPYEPGEFPELYWYYYSARVVVIDSTTGLMIDDSVWVSEVGLNSTTITFENGQITLYDSVRTEISSQPKNLYSKRSFKVEGYYEIDWITIKFHKDSSEYYPQYVKIVPDTSIHIIITL